MNFYQVLEALEYYTLMYHGTGVSNLPGIMQKGLQLNVPRTTTGVKTPAIYLTPNIELAARYAMGGLSTAPLNRIPVVLEIKLFGKKRHNKMVSDPLDRADNAWQDHFEYSKDERLEDLERDIVNFVNNIAKRYKFGNVNLTMMPKSFPDEIEGLHRFPLYNYIHSIIAKLSGKLYPSIRGDISKYILQYFPPDETYADGEVAINNSGTLYLTPEFWQNQHQNVYSRIIPPKAIKAVWVRKSDFPNVSGEEKDFGHEILPSEVVDEFEYTKKKLEDVGEKAKKIVYGYEEEDKDYYVDELEELKQGIDDDVIINLIDKLIANIDKDIDFDSILDKLDSRGLEMSSYAHDDYHVGKSIVKDVTTWVRVENIPSIFIR